MRRITMDYNPSPLNKNRRQYIRDFRKGVRKQHVDYIDLIWYYRDHPVEATLDLLKINLMPYQKEILRKSWRKPFPLWVMSRGSGKSYLAAIDMGLNVLLFPRMRVGIIAPSYRQSKFLFLKFKEEVYDKSPLIRKQCVKQPSTGMEQCIVNFKNGSFIQALPFGANSGGANIRGQRYNLVYVDEYAAIDEHIVRLVVEPMLTVKRNFDPNNPEASESNRIVIFSSAYYTFNHFYNTTQRYLNRVKNDDKDYYVAIVDYRMPLKYGLYDEKAIAKAKRDNTEGDFLMEYASVFQAESMGTWIPTSLFDRKIVFDQNLEPMTEGNPNKKYWLLCDFSISKADTADNTTFLVAEYEESGQAKIVSLKAQKGMELHEIHAEIRDIYRRFNLTNVTMDGEKLGLAIKGYLGQPYICPKTGVEMPPMIDVEDAKHQPDIVGDKILNLIRHSSELNHILGLSAKRMVEQGKLIMPVLQDRHEETEIEMMFLDMIALKKEVTNIKAVPNGMYYKFEQEKNSGLKRDRWTVFSYLCKTLEDHLNKEDEEFFYLDVIS
jgi:Terminase large subunit, T4likevirus-type, N-terminal